MNKIERLKKNVVNRLCEIDLEGLTIAEINYYIDAVKKADELFKPDWTEKLLTTMNGFNGINCNGGEA